MAVFFFQAEDGIRVDLVTGVQTCALPISIPSVRIDLETTMEDTHVWLIGADGKNRVELGAAIDNRQGEPGWSADGRSVLFTVQERGSVRLYRMPAIGGKAVPVVEERGRVGSWSAHGDQ